MIDNAAKRASELSIQAGLTYRKSVMGFELYYEGAWCGTITEEHIAQVICSAVQKVRRHGANTER